MFKRLRKVAKAKVILKSHGFSYDTYDEHQGILFIAFKGKNPMYADVESILKAKTISDIELESEWYTSVATINS
jgi:hypothetical protein